jgi:putative transposase
VESGRFYHIYNRGINKQTIFFRELNCDLFLDRVNKYLSGYIEIYAYCLMINHFHFLIRIKENAESSKIDNGFKNLFMSYAKAINEQEKRTGSLFQQKFKRKEIGDDHYFSWIIQYIHMNPVLAGLCKEPELWKYSSYNAIISDKATNLRRNEVLEWFGSKEEFIRIHQERKMDIHALKKFLF